MSLYNTKDFSSVCFQNCTTALGKQVEKLDDAYSILASGISESDREYADEYINRRYVAVKSIIDSMRNSTICDEQSLGKTSSLLYQTDKTFSAKIADIDDKLIETKNQIADENSKYLKSVSGYNEVEEICNLLGDDRKESFKKYDGVLSSDLTKIYYHGKDYLIEKPILQSEAQQDDGVNFLSGRKLVKKISYDVEYFDTAEAFAGMSDSSIDGDAFSMADNGYGYKFQTDVPNGIMSIWDLGIKFILDGKKKVTINMNFYEDDSNGRSVNIGLQTDSYKSFFENNAGKRVSLQETIAPDGGYWSKKISDNMKLQLKNSDIPYDEYGTYDFVWDISAYHKNSESTLQLYFDKDQNLCEYFYLGDDDHVMISEKTGFRKKNDNIKYEYKHTLKDNIVANHLA